MQVFKLIDSHQIVYNISCRQAVDLLKNISIFTIFVELLLKIQSVKS